MYRRLIAFGLAVCSVALVALVIPLALAARDIVQSDALSDAAARARSVAADWEALNPHDGHQKLQTPNLAVGDGQVTLIAPDGRPVAAPPPPPQAQPVVQAASTGASASQVVDGYGYVASPAYLDERIGVVLVTLSPAELRDGLFPRLAALAVVSLILLGCAGLAAWLLARRTVAPLRDLTHTANQVADGDLQARAPASSVAEIEQVGVALNRLTGRVQELLEEERSYTAELAHQLRTPLTVLSVDIDGVGDPEVQERLRDDVDAVQRMVDEIINAARRSTREGLAARCDACEVVTQRLVFWKVLAEDQGRSIGEHISGSPLPVRLTADDLASAVDILLQNVFLHTPEGTDFTVQVVHSQPWVDVIVSDDGPGFGRSAGLSDGQPGSTGLGLSIAARLCEASGGELLTGTSPSGGARIMMRLGPPRS